jgi:hypothetical protein
MAAPLTGTGFCPIQVVVGRAFALVERLAPGLRATSAVALNFSGPVTRLLFDTGSVNRN